MDDLALDVIVFARRPRAGQVKRRLARAVGARHAARCYAQTLAQTLAAVEALRHARRILMPASAADAAWFQAHLARRGWRVQTQVQGDLGRRMAAACARRLRVGRPVLLIGSDLVDVGRADLDAARRALGRGADIVLGPAADGGYWLIGMRAPHPEVFEAVPWGGPEVLACTLAAARRAVLATTLVAVRHDLDRGADLLRRGHAPGGRWCRPRAAQPLVQRFLEEALRK